MKALTKLLPYISHHKGELGLGFLFMFIMNYAYVEMPVYFNYILQEIMDQNRTDVVLKNMGIALLFIALAAFCMFKMRLLIISTSRHIEYRLRKNLYEKLIYQDFDFFAKNKTGDLISRCTNDLDQVRVLLGPGIMYIPNSLSRLVFFTPILFSLNVRLAWWLIGLIVILVVLIIWVMPAMKKPFKNIQEHVGAINDRVWQVLTGIQTIKLYTREKNEETRFEFLNKEYIKKNMVVEGIQAFLWPFFITVFGLSELVLIGVGGQEVIKGNLELGELLQFKIMIVILAFPVLSLGWVMSLIQQGISAMERINLILDSESTQKPRAITENKIEGNSLECKNLNFKYPDHEKNLLKGINLHCKTGETIGLTGPIGCGKSTLLELICGILKPNPGELFVGDQDVLNIDPEEHYRLFSYVPQNSFLFSNTVENNIALSELPDTGLLTDQQKSKVVDASSLAALDKDIQGFSKHYEEIVGEKGITLSGGQKQRVAIARAMYKSLDFLVFDDSLSSIDAETEKEILEHIKTLGETRSMIIVSHKISSLLFCDRIYYMNKGQIIEEGSHEELIKKEGEYAKLVKLQKLMEED
jgi:ATP-binding cassette, subfamily B, multidrug efflux pump